VLCVVFLINLKVESEFQTTEANLAVERTICIVTDHAPSSMIRANADRRSL